MSTLTTSRVNTADGLTNLTLTTGNTGGPVILVTGGTDVNIRANTTGANVFIANSSQVRTTVATTIANNLTVANNLNVTGTLTPATLTLGSPSIATSGHSRLPNGLLLQWGTVTGVNSSAGSITFPTAFAAAPYSITVQQTVAAAEVVMAVTALSATTATVRSVSGTVANTAYWMAIGV